MVEALLNINFLPHCLSESIYIGRLKQQKWARAAKYRFSGILLPSSSMFRYTFNAMTSISLCSDCVDKRCHSGHYCIFMNITRRFGLGAIAVLSGMRGVGKNLAVQCRKRRENSTATYCSAFIANHAGWGAYAMPNGWSLFTTDCVIYWAGC